MNPVPPPISIFENGLHPLNRLTYHSYGEVVEGSWKILMTAQKTGDWLLEAESWICIAQYEKDRGNYKHTRKYLQKALRILRNYSTQLDWRGYQYYSHIYCLFGNAADESGEYANALKYHRKSYEYGLVANDGFSEQRGLCNLGRVSHAIGNLNNAIDYSLKAIHCEYQNERFICTAYETIATVMMENFFWNDALFYLEHAFEVVTQNK